MRALTVCTYRFCLSPSVFEPSRMPSQRATYASWQAARASSTGGPAGDAPARGTLSTARARASVCRSSPVCSSRTAVSMPSSACNATLSAATARSASQQEPSSVHTSLAQKCGPPSPCPPAGGSTTKAYRSGSCASCTHCAAWSAPRGPPARSSGGRHAWSQPGQPAFTLPAASASPRSLRSRRSFCVTPAGARVGHGSSVYPDRSAVASACVSMAYCESSAAPQSRHWPPGEGSAQPLSTIARHVASWRWRSLLRAGPTASAASAASAAPAAAPPCSARSSGRTGACSCTRAPTRQVARCSSPRSARSSCSRGLSRSANSRFARAAAARVSLLEPGALAAVAAEAASAPASDRTARIRCSCSRHRLSRSTTAVTASTLAPRRRCDSRATSGSPPASTRKALRSSI
mmetsp:Transcript_36755/g.117847  ORF Transcript_36755/g.117847 Transcript_36755/m.117847 type:complete len:406 (+) Transcript_36755:206-1423(+)